MNHRQQEDVDARSIYVGNLDCNITVQRLRNHFHLRGTIKQITIIFRIFSDNANNQKGHAFIEFESEVNDALSLDGSTIDENIIIVARKWINTRTIYVSNLHNNVTEDELSNHFHNYGEIHHINIFNGYAFIGFTTSAAVNSALRANNTLLGGRRIHIRQDISPDDLHSHFRSSGEIKRVFICDKDDRNRFATINFVARFSINQALRRNNTLLRGTRIQ
ncbi:4282_t:CDS:2, partial [Racocetra persica]